MSARENKAPAETMDFEKSLARLEALVKEMEGGALSLDKMMERFEEGSQLIKICDAKLNEVEKKIETLVKKGEAVTTEPFDPEDRDSD
ncbi:MAG: exodeoxyribonuclease VII small subunit [Kiritimatiellae bacterium]|nr:exodeoxyribonuclease VII small subunit [Kiritimatiellia bacterium]